jgi:hypothetical protein
MPAVDDHPDPARSPYARSQSIAGRPHADGRPGFVGHVSVFGSQPCGNEPSVVVTRRRGSRRTKQHNGRMRWGTAKPTLRRPTRRSLGLADDEQVVTMWAGPPELTLEDRAGTLRACRQLLATDGYRIAHVSPGIIEIRIRRRPPKVLTGDDALAALERDEAVADADEHWWLHDVVWGDPATSRHVCAGVDPDGNDLTWIGWGDKQVGDTIERLQEMLRGGGT